MVCDAIVSPLREGAEVIDDASCIEKTRLLKHHVVVAGELARVGVGCAPCVRQRQLQHGRHRNPRRRAVGLEREQRTLAVGFLGERIAAQLELPPERGQLGPAQVAVDAFEAGLACKAGHCVRRYGAQERRHSDPCEPVHDCRQREISGHDDSPRLRVSPMLKSLPGMRQATAAATSSSDASAAASHTKKPLNKPRVVATKAFRDELREARRSQ